MSEILEFSLYGNACDSIDQVVELLTLDSGLDESTRYKRAILSIYHGLELLLKERLRLIHPSLVWENVDNYPDLSSRTVGSDRALVRLKNIGGLSFTTAQEKIVSELRKTRNAIEHYTWSISKNQAEHIVGNGLGFVICFAKKHLDHDILGFEQVKDGILSELMWSNVRFKEAYENIKKEFDKSLPEGSVQCEFCKSYIVVGEDGLCPRCGHWHNRKLGDYPDGLDIDDMPF